MFVPRLASASTSLPRIARGGQRRSLPRPAGAEVMLVISSWLHLHVLFSGSRKLGGETAAVVA